MKTESRFLRLPDPEPETIAMILDGIPMMARPGDSVAAALLAQSGRPSRRTAAGDPRAPFCMMGVCFECLVEIDGRPNVQACMTPVRDGMAVRRQSGFRRLSGGSGDA